MVKASSSFGIDVVVSVVIPMQVASWKYDRYRAEIKSLQGGRYLAEHSAEVLNDGVVLWRDNLWLLKHAGGNKCGVQGEVAKVAEV